jgi:tetratricopeptide (TPR) repeat protein
VKIEAARLSVLAEVRLARSDRAGARQALEDATRVDPDFWAANVALGALYEQLEQWDAAVDRYRRALAKNPKHVVAMNNLAYTLAEHRNAAAEALPIAQQAYAESRGAPMVADTLGWILHALGNDREAEPLLVSAAKASPGAAEIQLHAAVVLAATGKLQQANAALDQALRLDTSLQTRADVRRLRERLK